MDTSDKEIVFDEKGVCNHCHDYDWIVKEKVMKGKEAGKRLNSLIAEIKSMIVLSG